MLGDPNWSEDFQYCRLCLKTNYNHEMDGYCQKCFKDMEMEKKKDKKTRTCLRCNKEFMSDGPGNRRCDLCLRRDSGSPHQYRITVNTG